MKKLLNYRPIVFFAVALMLGVIIAKSYFAGESSLFSFIFVCSIMALLLLLIIVGRIIFCKIYDIKLVFKRILCVILGIMSGIGSVLAFVSVFNYNKIDAGTYSIHARVFQESEKTNDTSDTYRFVADEVVLVKDNNSYSVKGRVKFYVYSSYIEENLNVGEYISFSAYLYPNSIDAKQAKSGGYSLYSDMIYTIGSVYTKIQKQTQVKVNALELFKLKSRDVLINTLDKDYAGLAYGMLFGDTSLMSDDITQNYRDAGISHLLAVSGLHVGFVVTLLVFFLSRLKVDNKISFIVVSITLFLYLFICNFSVSMVRAFIMTITMLACKIPQKKYDSISALALALIIILLISPLSLFDISLQLSFSAVLGILLLAKPLEKLFAKFLYRPFASALALSLSASIGTSIVTMYAFSNINLFQVFTNMIVIPIASIAYMILFICLIISLIIPATKVILLAYQYIMIPVSGVAIAASNISINNLPIRARVGLGAMLYGSLVTCSDYVLASYKKKIFITITLIFASLIIMFI